MRSYDLDNAIISYDPRTSLFQAKTPNGVPLTSNRNSMPQSPYIHNNNQRQTPTVSMSSNLSYPSETNRGKLTIRLILWKIYFLSVRNFFFRNVFNIFG